MPERYAIYYAPEHGSALAAFGARWLGRDAASGMRCVQCGMSGISDDEMARYTALPARYGFHATLKPPFALAADRSRSELLNAVRSFAAERAPVSLGQLDFALVGSFLALVPRMGSEDLNLLAAECVTLFDGFRAPPTREELDRRRAKRLTPRQEELLERFGYPYVLDQFRFHMTLTAPIGDETLRRRFRRDLGRRFSPLTGERFMLRELCVFHQADTDKPFTILKRFQLTGTQEREPLFEARAI